MDQIMNSAELITKNLVSAILDAGYSVSVSNDRGYDVDDMLLGCDDLGKIMTAAVSDDCHLFIHDKSKPTIVDGSVNSLGWVFLVPINGVDVITDYSANQTTESLIASSLELANQLDELFS